VTVHLIASSYGDSALNCFGDADDALYCDLLAGNGQAAGVEVWAWCLMPNHLHLILVPSDPDGLRRALARVHPFYPASSRRGASAAGTSGRAASAPSRWRRSASRRHCAIAFSSEACPGT
jgi:hypothetical protein